MLNIKDSVYVTCQRQCVCHTSKTALCHTSKKMCMSHIKDSAYVTHQRQCVCHTSKTICHIEDYVCHTSKTVCMSHIKDNVYVTSKTVYIKLQALVYDILPSTTAVFSYAIRSRKLSANKAVFCWCSNSSKFITNNSNSIRQLFYVASCLHQLK